MGEVAKKAGVTAWTGAWCLPVDRADHRKAVRRQRRRERRELADARRDPARR